MPSPVEGGREEKDGGNGKSTAAWREDASCIVIEGGLASPSFYCWKEGQKSKVKLLVKALWLNTRLAFVPPCFRVLNGTLLCKGSDPTNAFERSCQTSRKVSHLGKSSPFIVIAASQTAAKKLPLPPSLFPFGCLMMLRSRV